MKRLGDLNLSPDKLLAFFRKVPLLHSVRDEELSLLVQKCRPYCYKQGETVFHVGDASHRMYFIYDGLIAEFVSCGTSDEIMILHKKKYEYIGEMGVLLNQDYPNTVTASTDLILLGVPKQIFCPLAMSNPEILLVIIDQLSNRLLKASQKMINFMNLDAEGRLAFTLLRLTSHADGGEISISATQAQLAGAAGTVRQTVARVLGEWRKEGYISTQRGRIVVEDINALLDVVSNSSL